MPGRRRLTDVETYDLFALFEEQAPEPEPTPSPEATRSAQAWLTTTEPGYSVEYGGTGTAEPTDLFEILATNQPEPPTARPIPRNTAAPTTPATTDLNDLRDLHAETLAARDDAVNDPELHPLEQAGAVRMMDELLPEALRLNPTSPPPAPSATVPSVPAVDFVPPAGLTVPTTPTARADANIAAIQVLRELQAQDRPATPDEQTTLAAWSGWGAVPDIFTAPAAHSEGHWWRTEFDHRDGLQNALNQIGDDLADQIRHVRATTTTAQAPAQLRRLLPQLPTDDRPSSTALNAGLRKVITSAEWDHRRAELNNVTTIADRTAAVRSTLNAHYTDPMIAQQMWDLLERLGFQGGRVLEPGCGSGNFIGRAPTGTDMVGVELDGTTAAIAGKLFPSATIVNSGFQAAGWNPDAFTATIGNVPFGDFKVYDPEFNSRGHNIHNHFLAKSLRLTAPGGIVAALTSTWTMDGTSPAARRELHAYGDLIGAVRFPRSAFSQVAGTDVMIDLLVLRRRKDDERPQPFSQWEKSVRIDTPGGHANINSWFLNHPELVLGDLIARPGRFGIEAAVTAFPDIPLADSLTAALDHVVDRATDLGLLHSAPAFPPGEPFDPSALAHPDQQIRPGTIRAEDNGTFSRLDPITNIWTPFPIGAKTALHDRDEARALLELRDGVAELITGQQRGDSDEQRETARTRTRALYQAYTDKHGPINRFTLANTVSWPHLNNLDPDDVDPEWETAPIVKNGIIQVDPDGQPLLKVRKEALTQKRPVAIERLRKDPAFAAVLALEIFDDDTQTSTPAPILTRDVIAPAAPPLVVASAGEALAVSMNQLGTVDLALIASLMEGDITLAQARQELGNLVFDDPDTGELVPAVTYLSGDVRTKLATAQQAAEDDTRFTANVAALETVVPALLTPADIEARPGVTWVPIRDYRAFVQEVLAVEANVTYEPVLASWEVQVPGGNTWSSENTRTYGVPTHSGLDLFQSLLNNAPVNVTKLAVDWTGKERSVPDPDATELANSKRSAIADRFQSWLWADTGRAERLATEYNRRFNSHAHANYDGSYLTLPGLGKTYDPRPTQTAAVARILDQPTVLLDHVVGAGKTGTMLMGAMELRRMGMSRQPWIVVPNHIAEQVTREAKQWYPAAKVLAGHAGMSAEDRREFVAMTATADYDIVIVPETVFTAIPVSPSTQAEFLRGRIAELDDALLARRNTTQSNDRTVKDLEKAKIRLEEKVTKALAETKAGSDNGLNFESSGCDYVFVDEAHHYKNRAVLSSTPDLARSEDSQRAMDLSMKLQVIRTTREDAGQTDRVATFATGTPIANSPREMWVMLEYLRPDLLEHAGVGAFDAWVANHLRPQTRLEMKPTGSGFQPRTRITQFVNVPEMSQMWRQMADLVTRENLPVKLPDIVSGSRQTVALPRTDFQAAYAEVLDKRVEAVKLGMVEPTEDNMLAITGDGRKAALDQRLVGEGAPADGGRPTAVANKILDIHTNTRSRQFLDDDGNPHPRPGGLQIVFLDQSTPKKNGDWTVYRQLRDELIAGGIPADQVRFIHDSEPGRERTELFAACNDGRVAVLIGSTGKLGTGANIQNRALALHHVDVPWRPADLEQREGRIIRQKNQNDTVEIWTYVTESSFDAFSWNLVAVKAGFIGQIKNGTTSRHVDADDSDTISFEQIAAISSGDPRVLERYQLGQDLGRLERLERAHIAQSRNRQFELRTAQASVDLLEATLDAVITKAATITPTDGDQFAFYLDHTGRTYRNRREAGTAIAHHIAAQPGRRDISFRIGKLGGQDITFNKNAIGDQFHLTINGWGPGTSSPSIVLAMSDLQEGGDRLGAGLVTRLENLVASCTTMPAKAQATLDRHRKAITDLQALTGDDAFPDATKLAETRLRIRKLDTELSIAANQVNLDPPPPGWMDAIPEADRANLVWGPRLDRLHPDGASTYGDIHKGDILASQSANSPIKRVLEAYGHTRTIMWEPLGADPDTEPFKLSKRSTTAVGVLARHRDGLTPIELAIADAPWDATFTTAADVTVGTTISAINAADRYYGNTPITGTVEQIRPGRVRGSSGFNVTFTDGTTITLIDTEQRTIIVHAPPADTADNATGHQPAVTRPTPPDPTPAPAVNDSSDIPSRTAQGSTSFTGRLRQLLDNTLPTGTAPATLSLGEINDRHLTVQAAPNTRDFTLKVELHGQVSTHQLTWPDTNTRAQQDRIVLDVLRIADNTAEPSRSPDLGIPQPPPELRRSNSTDGRIIVGHIGAPTSPPAPAAAAPQPVAAAHTDVPRPVVPAADTATSTGSVPLLRHGPDGTTVHNTDKHDDITRSGLTGAGFKWSRAQQFWYIPRNCTYDTRTAKVERLIDHLTRNGRGIEHGTPETTGPATTPPTDQPARTTPAAASVDHDHGDRYRYYNLQH